MREQILLAAVIESVLPCRPSFKENIPAFSSPIDSESMKSYYNSLPDGSKIAAFDLHTDGTLVSSSGSQSVNTIRIRMADIRGRSTTCHEIGLAPSIPPNFMKSKTIERSLRLELFQRFLFLLLYDSIIASRDRMVINGSLLLVCLNTLVADQPQECAFYSLKGAQSYMDYSICMMQWKPNSQNSYRNDTNSDDETDDERRLRLDSMEKIHERQISGRPASYRNPVVTVWFQLCVTGNRLSLGLFHRGVIAENLLRMQIFLQQTSATTFPPALASFYGFGTRPFRLCRSIALDRLHCFDLGPA